MNPLIDHAMTWVRSQLPEPGDRLTTDQDVADAALMAKVMRGPDGPALLDILARATVLRPATDPRLTGPASHDYCQRRTGENGVFAVVVHLLDLHDHLQTRTDDHGRRTDPAPVFGWSDAPGLAGTYAGGESPRAEDGGGDVAAFDPGGTVAAG